jgi:putative methyltransferase
MRVLLADLFHLGGALNPDTAPYTVPLGIGYVAATAKRRVKGIAVELFRDPDRLVQALKREPAQVLGFSIANWNLDLTRRVARLARAWSPATVLVAGGPCIDDEDGAIVDFLRAFPELDCVVPSEGENGFAELLEHLKAGPLKRAVVPGAAFLDERGALVRGKYVMPQVAPEGRLVRTNATASDLDALKAEPELDSEIPSPYLDGTLDAFLADGLVPIVQTMRGCPYRCEFCVSGTVLWNKPRGFPLERVRAEIEYALERSGAKDLILTDENWGILGERDVELARHLIKRSEQLGSPKRLYFYTAKIVNDASRTIAKLVAPIAWNGWIGELTMSFQTLNPESRKAIKRTNISIDKVEENVAWAKQHGIRTASEMIYGFPYETPATFIDGVEVLLQKGVRNVAISPLQLFAGIDLDSPEARANNGMKTMFRLADCGYGSYMQGELISVEAEEIVVETKWSGKADYFVVRRFGFFMMLLFGRPYFDELVRLCAAAGVDMPPLIRFLALQDFAEQPTLAKIFQAYDAAAAAELFPSREELYASVAERVRRRENLAGVKLNLVFLGHVFRSVEAVRELFGLVEEYLAARLPGKPGATAILSYLHEVLPNRVVVLDRATEERVRFSSRFDYAKWSAQSFGELDHLLLPEPRSYEAVAHGVLLRNLASFAGDTPGELQSLFDRTPAKSILRDVSPSQ